MWKFKADTSACLSLYMLAAGWRKRKVKLESVRSFRFGFKPGRLSVDTSHNYCDPQNHGVHIVKRVVLCACLFCLYPVLVQAEKSVYVIDQITITLRAGQGTHTAGPPTD